ncbi:hypothetical protein CAL14_05425 [Bordetella genomosp. 9]|uniref:hypothetical protein n=1 Tax=Bordetella genomosp. 9 TaxID=1416803 RepID=UPI000A296CCC|nr:hypothetical protein [Bordetella genomosp. 9]ARP89795.1 hypothetical protein CAL14_05425 [Bordetella genomosp. 9]
MSADNRSTHTDALASLGTIIDASEKRDAIHLAVEPVEAGVKLAVGAHVELRDGKAYAAAPGEGVGIVDPFLMDAVKKGERFWLVVYPRQITSLRHVWEHPAFPASGETGVDPATANMHPSEKWIRDWCATIPLDYHIVMDGARDYVESQRKGGWGEYLCFGGLLEGESVPAEFWPHYEAVTGEKVEEDHRGSFFTCSC